MIRFWMTKKCLAWIYFYFPFAFQELSKFLNYEASMELLLKRNEIDMSAFLSSLYQVLQVLLENNKGFFLL